MIRVFSALGWLVLLAVVATQGGCSALDKLPAELPKIEAPDARSAYKTALAACLVCAVPDGLPADVAAACEELAPVCDALAGVCK